MRENEWLLALKKGDMSWFPELVEAYQDKIFALAFRKTCNTADAEDLAQEIFIQFYRKLHKFRAEAALSTWLYRVALNRASSYIRGRRELTLFGDDMPEISSLVPPDEALLHDEGSKAILAAMAKLKPSDREVLELFYFQDRTAAQTATILDLSVRGVETRLRRARERMKFILGDMGYFEEVMSYDDTHRPEVKQSEAERLQARCNAPKLS